jgi:hypothetical protein
MDIPQVPDTGVGVYPIVDMGAYEFCPIRALPEENQLRQDWEDVNEPVCWCAPYQCDGDADCETESAALKYRIYANDLDTVVKNWKTKITDPTLNPCADFDHKSEGPTKYRVYTKDLNILITNWKRKDAQLPGDCPRLE